MGIADADTAENDSGSRNIVIAPVSCAVPNRAPGEPKLVGAGHLSIEPGSSLHAIYGRNQADERYFCNYEVNPQFEARLQDAGLRIVARGPQAEIRAVELPSHRFFLATLFQPQLSSQPGEPHPVVTAFFAAARQSAKSQRA